MEGEHPLSHKNWYRDGLISKKEFDNLEFLKKMYPNLYKGREKLIGKQIKNMKKARKLIRKGKPVPL